MIINKTVYLKKTLVRLT